MKTPTRFKNLVHSYVRPVLEEQGFEQEGARVFVRRGTKVWPVVEFERYRTPSMQSLEVTFSAGLYVEGFSANDYASYGNDTFSESVDITGCILRARVAEFLRSPTDVWWSVRHDSRNPDASDREVGLEMQIALTERVFPIITKFTSIVDLIGALENLDIVLPGSNVIPSKGPGQCEYLAVLYSMIGQAGRARELLDTADRLDRAGLHKRSREVLRHRIATKQAIT